MKDQENKDQQVTQNNKEDSIVSRDDLDDIDNAVKSFVEALPKKISDICGNCEYKQLDPNALFCAKCGTKLEEIIDTSRRPSQHSFKSAQNQVNSLLNSTQKDLESLGIIMND